MKNESLKKFALTPFDPTSMEKFAAEIDLENISPDLRFLVKEESPVHELQVTASNGPNSVEKKAGEVQLEPEVEDTPLPFPLGALNTTMRMAVETIASAFRQDPVLAGTGALVGLAGAVGRLYRVNALEDRKTYANLYGMVGASRGRGKGASARSFSAVTDKDVQLKADFEANQAPSLKVLIAMTEKDLKEELGGKTEGLNAVLQKARLVELQKSLETMRKQLATPPALIVGSTTGAALVGALERNNGQLFSYNPEVGDTIKIAMGRFTSDGGGDFDLFLSGYSVETFSESRSSRGTTTIDKPCMSVLWMPQPSLMNELLSNEDARERGLLARFLVASIQEGDIPEDDGMTPPLSQEALHPWDAMLNRALDLRLSSENPPTADIECSAEARGVFREYYNEVVRLRNGPFRDVQGELSRVHENSIRLALGQCIADAIEANQTPIVLTADHARRGIALSRFYTDQFMRLLRPAQVAIRLKAFTRLESICRSKGGFISLRDLKNSHLIGEEEVRRVVANFTGRLRIETPPASPRGGRPSTILRLIG